MIPCPKGAQPRAGEEIGDVFLFYNLKPLSVSANGRFTKEGAKLIFYDTESGEKVEVNLGALRTDKTPHK